MSVAITMFYRVILILCTAASLHCGDALNFRRHVGDGPCPEPSAIAPCLCLYDATLDTMDLLCEFIQSEEQLATVFNSNFPVPHFRRFEMIANTHVKVLNSGVFGTVSFEEIYITPGVLHEIQEGVFDASRDTLQFLDLGKNEIETFPILESTSMNHLLLASCPIFDLPANAFEGLPNLEIINMYGLRLSDIKTGTFSTLTKLREVILSNQILHLTHIPSGAFIGSEQLMTVNLFGNMISSVEVDAFPVVSGMDINLASNRMTVIDEHVWEQYIQAGATLHLDLNPLECGCDLAWLFKKPSYLNHVNGHCHEDGEQIQDLSPGWFEEYCP
ncbi:unnamed protein product [Meganyctiphanes norvegica]|uniref:Oplophorus-luciferin 2-monooxygenase non-catalytic subunit n=1 Tax=Meganyctiphanes norvegica TaxID=48144 RepID=A0AAV2SD36_MEGNR